MKYEFLELYTCNENMKLKRGENIRAIYNRNGMNSFYKNYCICSSCYEDGYAGSDQLPLCFASCLKEKSKHKMHSLVVCRNVPSVCTDFGRLPIGILQISSAILKTEKGRNTNYKPEDRHCESGNKRNQTFRLFVDRFPVVVRSFLEHSTICISILFCFNLSHQYNMYVRSNITVGSCQIKNHRHLFIR